MGTSSYTPLGPGGASTATSGSSLSGAGGTSAFLNTQIAVTPGAPAKPGVRDTSAATRNDPDYAGASRTTPAQMPQTKSVSALIAELYRLPKDQLQALQTRLTQAGYGKITPTGIVDQDTVSAYQSLLQDTASYQAFDNRGLGQAYTPDSFLDSKIASANATAAGADTSTLSDPFTARMLVVNSLQSHLGRTPTPDEIGQFTSALQSYEQTSANPDPSAFADAYATSTQTGANEAGALNETRFVDILHNLMGSG